MSGSPPEIQFATLLAERGVHAALAFLNARTPHRYTGIFRFDGDFLRNEFLFDQFDASVRRGEDAPLERTWCALIDASGAPLEFDDVRASGLASPDGGRVKSYCGIAIRDRSGRPVGTLCHFDEHPCEPRLSDQPLLLAVAPLLRDMLGEARERTAPA